MSKDVLAVLTLISTLAFPAVAWSQGKITDDPNNAPKVEASAAAPVDKTDTRLDQNIEYDAGNMRLHDVVAEISKKSGIAIYCGTSTDDWRVRDIPMTIAWRNLPLRRLLKTINFVTRTDLVPVKTDKGIVYRVMRGPKTQQAIDELVNGWADYETKEIEWLWKQACQLKDIPLDQIKPHDRKDPSFATESWQKQLACSRAISGLLSALDDQTKAEVMSGSCVVLSAETCAPSLRPLMLKVFEADNYFVEKYAEFYGDKDRYVPVSKPATPEEMQKSVIILERSGADVDISSMFFNSSANPTAVGAIQPYVAEPHFRRGESTNLCAISWNYRGGSLAAIGSGPIQPMDPFWDQPEAQELEYIGDGPKFTERVEIKFPDDKLRKRYADDILALSKASGLSFVTQDFFSHHPHSDQRGVYDQPGRVVDKLRQAAEGRPWESDKEGKVLVCFGLWKDQYLSLVPEAPLEDLKAKAQGKGVQFDDAVSLVCLTPKQIEEWLRGDETLFAVCAALGFLHEPADRPLWEFINSLSPDERALARSEFGLKLAAYDSKLIKRILDPRRKSLAQTLARLGGEEFPEDRLAKPNVLPTLTLRIKETTMGVCRGGTGGFGFVEELKDNDPNPWVKKQCYSVIIEGNDGGERIALEVRGPMFLPCYTEDREKALYEAAVKAKKNTGK